MLMWCERPCLAALVLLTALSMQAGPLGGQGAPSMPADIDALYPDLGPPPDSIA